MLDKGDKGAVFSKIGKEHSDWGFNYWVVTYNVHTEKDQPAIGSRWSSRVDVALGNLIWFKSCAECIARRLIVSPSLLCRFAALDIPIFLLMPTIKRLPVRAAHLPMCHDETFPLS